MSLVCGWAANYYLIENWSYIPSVGKLPEICGLVGFESDFKGGIWLLVTDPKASVSFGQAGWAAGWRTGWGWHRAGGWTQSGAGTSSAGPISEMVMFP